MCRKIFIFSDIYINFFLFLVPSIRVIDVIGRQYAHIMAKKLKNDFKTSNVK